MTLDTWSFKIYVNTNCSDLLSKFLASVMRNYFSKRPSGASINALSKLYDISVSFVTPASFEAVYCFIWGRRRLAIALYRMISLMILLNYKYYTWYNQLGRAV